MVRSLEMLAKPQEPLPLSHCMRAGGVGGCSREDGGRVYEFRGGTVSGSDEDQGVALRAAPKYLRFLVKSQ